MFAKAHTLRLMLMLAVALGGVAGCLLVYPLDELPAAGGKHAGGNSAGGQQAGGASSGSSGDSLGGAAAGEAGEGVSAGQAGNGSTECTSNLECVNKDRAPSRCRPSDHTCVPLRSETCSLVYGDEYKDPNAIYFGAFATLNPSAPGDNSVIWSQRVALDELSGQLTGGLPGPNKTRRPLVMIVCNNKDDLVDAGISHLVNDVQVPGMIANLKPGTLLRAFTDHQDRDVFYLSPVTVSHVEATQEDDDKVWGLLGQSSDIAPAYAALLKLQEKRWLKDIARQPDDKLRVALIYTTAAFDTDLQSVVEPLLRFNDEKLALDNGDNYLAIRLDVKDPRLEEKSQAVIDFGPDVIISTASELFSMDGGLLELIELGWDAALAAKPRPFYVLSPYNTGSLSNITQLLNVFISDGVDSDPHLRFVGVSVADARDNTLQKAYESRLTPLFPMANPDSANYYDAVYFLAYAMFGAGTDGPLTGSRIAKGMRRLLDGTSYAVGPGNITDTFAALSSGSNVQVLSTLGPPGFDAQTGVRAVDGSVLCFQKTGTFVALHRNVLRYDHDQGTLTGAFPCFSGFFE